MRVDSLNLEQITKIKESIDIEDLTIYLRPKSDEFGSEAAPKDVYSLKHDTIFNVKDEYIPKKNDFASRFWLEIVGTVNGYFDEDGEFNKLTLKEDKYVNSNYEKVEMVLGVITGYIVEKTIISHHRDFGTPKSTKKILNPLSSNLRDLWNSLLDGRLKDLVNPNWEYFADDFPRIIYYLDDIYYTKGFEDIRVDKAAINLLFSAVDTYIAKNLEDIIYNPISFEVIDNLKYVKTSEDHYEHRIELLKNSGFIDVEENDLEYLVATEEFNLRDYSKRIDIKEDLTGKEKISDLSFRITLDNNLDSEDKNNTLSDSYNVFIKDDMKLNKKDLNILLNKINHEDTEDKETLPKFNLEIYDNNNRIGIVEYLVMNKVKNIRNFIYSLSGASQNASICACEILRQGFYKKVQGRRYAYIEDIQLDENYRTLENEGMVLQSILNFLKINFKVKRVFTKPNPSDLTEDELKVQLRKNGMLEYRNFDAYFSCIAGTHYETNDLNATYFEKLPRFSKIKSTNNYINKQMRTFELYKRQGFELMPMSLNVLAGVMYIEL